MHSAAKAAILKLCRIIMSHGERYVDKLRCNDIEGVLRSGIYLQENSITVSIASDCIAGDDPICLFDFFSISLLGTCGQGPYWSMSLRESLHLHH